MIRNPKAFEAWSTYSCWVHSVITELEMLSLPKETALIHFTPLEIMPRCSAAGFHFRIIPTGSNAPLEFLTGFTEKARRSAENDDPPDQQNHYI